MCIRDSRGAIQRELRKAQQDWLFGCDICLEVCPFAQTKGHAAATQPEDRPELTRHRALDTYDLVGVLELSREAWDTDWTGTAIRRATHSGLRRNAATVLGNLGDPRALQPLINGLEDPDPVVREHAAWAVAQIQPRHPALEKQRRIDPDAAVRREIEAGWDEP